MGLPFQNKTERFKENDPRKVLIVKLDPRIHFALNCGSRGCPPVKPYNYQTID